MQTPILQSQESVIMPASRERGMGRFVPIRSKMPRIPAMRKTLSPHKSTAKWSFPLLQWHLIFFYKSNAIDFVFLFFLKKARLFCNQTILLFKYELIWRYVIKLYFWLPISLVYEIYKRKCFKFMFLHDPVWFFEYTDACYSLNDGLSIVQHNCIDTRISFIALTLALHLSLIASSQSQVQKFTFESFDTT